MGDRLGIAGAAGFFFCFSILSTFLRLILFINISVCLFFYSVNQPDASTTIYTRSHGTDSYTELKLYKKLYCKEIVLCIWLDHLDDYKVCELTTEFVSLTNACGHTTLNAPVPI